MRSLEWKKNESGWETTKAGRIELSIRQSADGSWRLHDDSLSGPVTFWRFSSHEEAVFAAEKLVMDECQDLLDLLAPRLRWKGGVGELGGTRWLLCASRHSPSLLLRGERTVVLQANWGNISTASEDDAKQWAENALRDLGVVFRVEDGEQ